MFDCNCLTILIVNSYHKMLMKLTPGGDGTFLLGAAKIRCRDKPIIGINTDPTRSEGHLCLPKHYSFNVEGAIDKILRGEFSW